MDSPSQFKKSRRDEVIAFCRASGFRVPGNFDASPRTYRYVLVDVSQTTPVLHKQSGFMQAKVIAFVRAPENAGRRFRIFDFKRHVEVHDPGAGTKLIGGQPFDWNLGPPQNVA